MLCLCQCTRPQDIARTGIRTVSCGGLRALHRPG